MDKFYDTHKELLKYGNIKKYVKLDINGKIVEIWERDVDKDGPWNNMTEQYKLKEQVEAMKTEINKLKIKNALKTVKSVDKINQ